MTDTMKERAVRAEAKVARVEAVLRFWMSAGDLKAAIRAALAEPERDEESGR